MPTEFSKIFSDFDKVKDISQFCNTYNPGKEATRFLLIRSLDTPHLKEILDNYNDLTIATKLKDLMEAVYQSPITINELLLYIEKKRSTIIQSREADMQGVSDLLENFPIVSCGIRNDKVDDVIKEFVRNESASTMDLLNDALNDELLPRIKKYCLWSYYNQKSNDIIELTFIKHPNIIPTLRKIPNIDFFIKIGNDLVPFDLKFTHISNEYFNEASQGIEKSSDDIFDDYIIKFDKSKSEINIIKKYYKSFQGGHKNFNLPNFKDLKKVGKVELCDLLVDTGDPEARNFVLQMEQQHANYVPDTSDKLKTLEWWNYKNQGERLFCNNNRFFIFLAYKNKFEDGRAFKGKINAINEKIETLLNNITMDDIHQINYHYEKQDSLAGNYSALSISTIYSE